MSVGAARLLSRAGVTRDFRLAAVTAGQPRGLVLEHWAEEDGPLSEKRLLRILEQEGYEVGVYAYREGTAFPEHEHAQDKCDAVLEGFFRVRAGEEIFEMKPGDRLYIPAKTRHSAEVVGRHTVLALDGTRW